MKSKEPILFNFALSSVTPVTEPTGIDQYPEESNAECQEKDHHIYAMVGIPRQAGTC